MKISPLFLLFILFSCHSTNKPQNPPSPTPDTAPVREAHDTAAPRPEQEAEAKRKGPIRFKTHLKDTTIASGSFILFLRPNDSRFAEEQKTDEDIGTADEDFGVGIGNTLDSLPKNKKYQGIRGLVSANRYILIKDCKDGPLVIDRDTIDFGVILSTSGKPIAATYNSVHSGPYMGEIDDYFHLAE
jgi:hypothetical protein